LPRQKNEIGGMGSLIITEKNLFKNNRCRFCQVVKGAKHENCFHGMADMLGTGKIEIEFQDEVSK
jgi:hypothetical protein